MSMQKCVNRILYNNLYSSYNKKQRIIKIILCFLLIS